MVVSFQFVYARLFSDEFSSKTNCVGFEMEETVFKTKKINNLKPNRRKFVANLNLELRFMFPKYLNNLC